MNVRVEMTPLRRRNMMRAHGGLLHVAVMNDRSLPTSVIREGIGMIEEVGCGGVFRKLPFMIMNAS